MKGKFLPDTPKLMPVDSGEISILSGEKSTRSLVSESIDKRPVQGEIFATMKNFVLVGLSVLLCSSAWGSGKPLKPQTQSSTSVSRAAPDRTYNETPSRMGLGIASVDSFLGTPA